MLYGVYAIRDLKTGYLAPTVDVNNASAVRNFSHAASRVDSLFYSHPADYQLFRIGTYDTEDGNFIPEQHELLASATDFQEVK